MFKAKIDKKLKTHQEQELTYFKCILSAAANVTSLVSASDQNFRCPKEDKFIY